MVKSQVPNNDSDRLARILDAKRRTIGVDVDGLAHQVAERKAREEAEKKRDIAFAKQTNNYAANLGLQMQQADAYRRTVGREISDFRATAQIKPTTREWDINRPDHIKIDVPARIGDDDPRLGVASLQKFDGEDLSIGDRVAAQIAQSRAWYDQQTAELNARRAAEKREQEQLGATLRAFDEVQLDIKRQEEAIRGEMNRSVRDTNKALAQERRLRELRGRESELRANIAEMSATYTSPLMTEDPAQAASALSQTRVRVDHWKGFSPAQRHDVLTGQLAQMEQNKRTRHLAHLEDIAFARNQQDILKTFSEAVRSAEDFRRAQAQAVAANLQAQASQKRDRDAALKELYTNKITSGFYEQFGTSHR